MSLTPAHHPVHMSQGLPPSLPPTNGVVILTCTEFDSPWNTHCTDENKQRLLFETCWKNHKSLWHQTLMETNLHNTVQLPHTPLLIPQCPQNFKINRTSHSLSHTCIAEPLTWNNSLTARQRHKQLETLYQKYPPLWYIIFLRPHPPGRPAITPHPPGDNSIHTRRVTGVCVCVWDMGLNTLSLTFYHMSLSDINLNWYSDTIFTLSFSA